MFDGDIWDTRPQGREDAPAPGGRGERSGAGWDRGAAGWDGPEDGLDPVPPRRGGWATDGDLGADRGPVAVVPPVHLLVVGLACAAVALVLALLSDGRPALALLGWLLGSLGCIGSATMYTLEDARRATRPSYFGRRYPGRLRVALLLLGALAVALSAWQFADWWSRQ